MGTAMASGVFGALLGPVVGAGAALIGVRAAFGAVAGVCALLAAGMARFEPSPPEPQPARAIFGAVRNAEFLRGLWLISLPALLFGTLNVLVPLALDKRGFTAAAIGAVWVATTAVEVVINPWLGRATDRVGPLRARALRAPRLDLRRARAGDHRVAVDPRPARGRSPESCSARSTRQD